MRRPATFRGKVLDGGGVLRFHADMRTDRRDPADLPAPLPLHAHAEEDLRYIRTAIERAGAFTSISGWGQVAVGITALAAAAIAPLDHT